MTVFFPQLEGSKALEPDLDLRRRRCLLLPRRARTFGPGPLEAESGFLKGQLPYGNPPACPGRINRPRPGRPAVLFTDELVVGPMQKKAPEVGAQRSFTGGASALPKATTSVSPVVVPSVVKHSRSFPQASPGSRQSLSCTQERKISIWQF